MDKNIIEKGRMTELRDNPAKYSDELMPIFEEALQIHRRVLDPFAGTGKIHLLSEVLPIETVGVELEPEWAAHHERTMIGDATDLPFPGNSFDAVCTSPCLTPDQRVLRASDMRWIASGDVVVGDQLVAFDEFGDGLKIDGRVKRRKWRVATVTQSYGARKKCVRVWLANGESVTCTTDHPWLTTQYADNSRGARWTRSDQLLNAPFALKQLDIWGDANSCDAGWLAGMFDGEGSLSWGAYGAPKLVLTQVPGPLLENAERILREHDFKFSTYLKSAEGNPCKSLFVEGGFPEILRLLGQVRPKRLLDKAQTLGVHDRSIQPWKVRIEAVESIGIQDIQGIETSTGTYIGEGYLMHNTYGNRMADHHDAQDDSTRYTYRAFLGRPLTPGNTGMMQWGAEYRATHAKALMEIRRVLTHGGMFVLNIKDHDREGKRQFVTDWWVTSTVKLGFSLDWWVNVPTKHNRHGENGEKRYPEGVYVFKKLRPTRREYNQETKTVGKRIEIKEKTNV